MDTVSKAYSEGKQAWREGKAMNVNPYYRSASVTYAAPEYKARGEYLAYVWESGWYAAQEKARFEQPTYWSTHDATNQETQ